MKFSFKNIQHDLLSPGNIFWKKNSGDAVLISKKGEALNLDLLKKFFDSGKEIYLEDGIDIHVHFEMKALYDKYSEEILMRDKIQWRDKLIAIFRKEFIEKENVVQFELDQLAWKLFSNLELPEGLIFIERDADLFRRHLSVASSYTYCAFLLGYYEPAFLNRLFSKTLQNLMELGASARILTLKEKLEYLRLQESFSSEDYEYLKTIASDEILARTVMFEKYDGSGPRNLNSKEMSDLEVVFVAINSLFGFTNDNQENIFNSIIKGDLNCGTRTLKMLQKILSEKEIEKEM
ncbi:MAG: hypothetical protein H7177_02860, partial [Rhizobacter sp.]|nr:hypothetical protein [Bacteriovorax sp.]